MKRKKFYQLDGVCRNSHMNQQLKLFKNKPQGKRPGAFLYPANASRLYIFEVEMFYRYNPRAAMIGTRGGPFLRAWHIL